ncbi:response regulator [Sulfitobacter sp. LCG007]
MTKILIVEDNDMNLDMLSRRLMRKGFEIVTARDGEAGIAQAKAESPDLILMDMSLPVLDGWQATRAIKSDPQVQAIPVIALTAHAMESDRQKAIEAGCDAFHTKPVDLKVLLGLIDDLLPA